MSDSKEKPPEKKPADEKKPDGRGSRDTTNFSFSDMSLGELLREQAAEQAPDQEPTSPPAEEPPKKPSIKAPTGKKATIVSWDDIVIEEKPAKKPAAPTDKPAADRIVKADQSWADISDLAKPKTVAAPPVAKPPSLPLAASPPVAAKLPEKPPEKPAEKSPEKPAEKPAEKIKEVAVNPEALLVERPKDFTIPIDRLTTFRDCIGLFNNLKNKPSVEKWPGTLVLRRYHPGEAVFRQGEAGMSAFYVITAADEDRLRKAKLIPPQRTMIDLEQTAEALAVHLAIARPAVKKETWVDRLTGYFAKKPEAPSAPRFIPIDAPVGVEYESRRAVLSAGDLFGEMSCLYRTPRSATVVAERDCYVVELLRNVLDQLKKDPKFKEEMDKKYKERVFGLQVLNLPLFRGLPENLVAWLRDKATLKSYRAGQIVCDEHDRPDDMVIIRSGLVKICQGTSSLFRRLDVLTWSGLAGKLVAADEGTPLARARLALGPTTLERLMREAHDPTALSADQWQDVLYALNDLIKGPPLGESDPKLVGPQYQALLVKMPKLAKDRTEADARRLNRTFLDDLLGGVVRSRRLATGPESIIQYASRGDLIGEMGVVLNRPRSASCIAYTHPRFGQALEDVKSTEEETVEVVILPAPAIREMMEMPDAEPMRRHIEELISTRQRADVQRQRLTPTADGTANARRISPEFEQLGLIQGQKLMLIDLDRCTRCDECVRACADTHADGRSRLFLEGPRFERYLVPITCRSCLDPVCLIGCPVGSIHRGDNKEIKIEDWCIGCGLCARQCPYGSIQMHDIGLIGNGARGWRFTGSDIDPKKRVNISGWTVGTAPFRKTRDFRAMMGPALGYWFARTFDVPKDLLNGYSFEFELTAPDANAQIYLNGEEVKTTERLKKDKRVFPIAEVGTLIRAKNNLILIRTMPKPDEEGTIFDLRLDASPRPIRAEEAAIEYAEKAVTNQAVVCDLCSSLPGQVPSCVNACPHDAAMRVDARTGFPAR